MGTGNGLDPARDSWDSQGGQDLAGLQMQGRSSPPHFLQEHSHPFFCLEWQGVGGEMTPFWIPKAPWKLYTFLFAFLSPFPDYRCLVGKEPGFLVARWRQAPVGTE